MKKQIIKMNNHKYQNILKISAKDRYGYFIRIVTDWQIVWLIRDEGEPVMLGNEICSSLLPVWPEKEFAVLYLTDEWKTYQVEGMILDDFLLWLDDLQNEDIQLATFSKENMQSIVVRAEEMKAHLLYELGQYEYSGFVNSVSAYIP